MLSRAQRRNADIVLAEKSRLVARSRQYPVGLRIKAFGVWLVFEFRVLIGWHSVPSRHLSFAWHGHYCGPGHTGTGKPTDALDAACLEHDQSYS